MLKATGKAAIIHPTGTGKSFIGFKLCEDFPEKKICWLSSSEYIFRTLLENLAANSMPKNSRERKNSSAGSMSKGVGECKNPPAKEGTRPDMSIENDITDMKNVRFFTYARLMSMTEAEFKEICPDYDPWRSDCAGYPESAEVRAVCVFLPERSGELPKMSTGGEE